MNNTVDMLSSLTLPTFVAGKEVKAIQLNTIVDVFKEAIEVLRDRLDYVRAFDNGSNYADEGNITDDIGATYKVLTFIRDLDSDLNSLTTDFNSFVTSTTTIIGDWANIYDKTKTNIVDSLNQLNTKIGVNYSAIIHINALLDGITVGVIEDLKNDIDIIQQTYASEAALMVYMQEFGGAGRTTETIKGNATAIAEINIDFATFTQQMTHKADLVGGVIPEDQLPETFRSTNKGRYATIAALNLAWPPGSVGLKSGDFAVVGTGNFSEFYSYDAIDLAWESSGFSGTVNKVNNVDADANGNVMINADNIEDFNTTNKFTSQSEKEKLSDAVVSSDNTVLNMIVLTQSEYEALIIKDDDTLYFIKEMV